MTRDAKLYFLTGKDWRPLEKLILEHKSREVKSDIAIFPVLGDSQQHHYAIISVSSIGDNVAEEYGASPGSVRDMFILELKKGNINCLYGDKTLVSFLNW